MIGVVYLDNAYGREMLEIPPVFWRSWPKPLVSRVGLHRWQET